MILVSLMFSVIALTFNAKELFWLEKKGLMTGQYWRLITFPFVFVGFTELFFGMSILYSFRVLERQMGSSKYGVLMVLALTVSSVLAFITLFLVSEITGDDKEFIYSGPYGLIFASLVLYYYYIPPTIPVPFFGIRFNDKIFIYIFSVLLALSHPPATIYYAYCGLFAGMLYHNDYFESYRIPDWLCQFCTKYISPILSLSPTISDNQAQTMTPNSPLPRRPSSNVFDFDSVHTYYSHPQPVRQPSPQHINYLISMGIDRETAIQVLMRCDDELNLAIENLFSHN
jgi:membrane associated rhomboid family serine protease